MSRTINVHFSAHLRRFVDLPQSCEATGDTVKAVMADLEVKYPGVTDYILHENQKLRQHVNLFLDEQMIADREQLSDSTLNAKELFVMQALSGG